MWTDYLPTSYFTFLSVPPPLPTFIFQVPTYDDSINFPNYTASMTNVDWFGVKIRSIF